MTKNEQTDLGAALDDKEREAWEAFRQHRDAWQQNIGTGNGAGLLAVSAMLVSDAASQWSDALVGSGWWFFAGLVVWTIALSQLRRQHLAIAVQNKWMGYGLHQKPGPSVFGGEKINYLAKAMGLQAAIAERARLITVCHFAAAGCFLGGVLTPLLSITLYG